MKLEGHVEKNAVYVDYKDKGQTLADAEALDKTVIWHKSPGIRN